MVKEFTVERGKKYMHTKYLRVVFGICVLIGSMGCWKETKAMDYSEATKIDKGEYTDLNGAHVLRTSFGKLAEDVEDFYPGGDEVYNNIFIRHRGEKMVWDVDLGEKKKIYNNNVFYDSYLVGKNVNACYPYSADQVFMLDKKGRLYFSGRDTCYLMFRHKTDKECDREECYQQELVAKNVKKCWSDEGMFAYVKDNRLYITGEIISQGKDCPDYETQQSFFEGKGNQIKEVISGRGLMSHFWQQKSDWGSVYVLMKDGSVWGMGNNARKTISDRAEKYISKFQMIIPNGVKQISANFHNVAAVKKDGTLLVWGKDIESNAKKYSAKPKKIAQNVKQVALANSNHRDILGMPKSVIMYVKKNGKAYGRGANYNFMLSDQCGDGWQSKPVFLMGNVKKVGGCTGISAILTNKNELYWSGYYDRAYFLPHRKETK